MCVCVCVCVCVFVCRARECVHAWKRTLNHTRTRTCAHARTRAICCSPSRPCCLPEGPSLGPLSRATNPLVLLNNKNFLPFFDKGPLRRQPLPSPPQAPALGRILVLLKPFVLIFMFMFMLNFIFSIGAVIAAIRVFGRANERMRTSYAHACRRQREGGEGGAAGQKG